MLQSAGVHVALEVSQLDPAQLARELVDGATSRKASDIVLLDLRPVSLIADYFILASGTSERQIQAIAEEMERRLKGQGITPLHSEGTAESGWLILDFGSVVAHVMSPQARDYYGLEELWQGAQLVVRIMES